MKELNDETKKSIREHLINALIDIVVGIILYLITQIID